MAHSLREASNLKAILNGLSPWEFFAWSFWWTARTA